MNTRMKLEAKEEQNEVTRELVDLPPLHYLFKIQNFSQLSNAKTNHFESSDFVVGGYKWRLRLCLYPKEKIEKGHISLYLVLSKSNSIPLEKEVNVYLKFFIHNQIQDKYLNDQDAKGRISRFRGTKTGWGFGQLLPPDVFNDPSNGYLINDSCTFGTEVFVTCSNNIRQSNTAYVMKELGDNNFSWNIQNFEKLKKERPKSEVFAMGGYKWSLWLICKCGDSIKKCKNLSAYLRLEDSEALNPGDKLNVEYVLRVRDQLRGEHYERFVSNRYLSASAKISGLSEFIPLDKLKDKSKGYITNGEVILGVQISLLTMVKQ